MATLHLWVKKNTVRHAAHCLTQPLLRHSLHGMSNTHGESSATDHQGALTTIPEASEIDALLSDYEVQEVIGQGGMGAVYKAWQPRLGRHVAIKVLPVGVGEHLQFAESFRTEARTMASLNHSHIVTVHDFGEAEEFMYLVLECVEGETLFYHLHEKTYTPEQIISIVLQVCDALTYAHNKNVVHRDIKSSNIIIGKDGMAKVVDFGLATLRGAPGLLRKNVQEGPVMGTPGYSAPEILRPGATVDHRADIYSLGVVLYEALTGRTMDEAWTAPSRTAGTPPQLDSIILKATKESPADRYQSIEQFATSLKHLGRFGTAKKPASAKKPRVAAAVSAPTIKPAATAVRGRPIRPPAPQSSSAPLIIGILVIIAIAAYFFFSGDPNKPAPRKPSQPSGPTITPTLPPGLNHDAP